MSRNLGRDARVRGKHALYWGEAPPWGGPEHGRRSTVYPGEVRSALRRAREAWRRMGGAASQTAGMRILESLLRWFSPFRLMKDVSRGTREERIAAYRYNRRRRGDLAACMRRWALVLAVAALLTEWFDALSVGSGRALGLGGAFAYLAAACATLLVCGLCVLFITAYVYIYLTSHEG